MLRIYLVIECFLSFDNDTVIFEVYKIFKCKVPTLDRLPVPYGELKHSGSEISFAPFVAASFTFKAALDKFSALTAPTAS